MISGCEPGSPVAVWRTSFLHSHETFRVQDAPLRPLLVKELWEILGGRALWTMLLLMCPLIGYSFFQAVSLYGEASAAGLQSSVLANVNAGEILQRLAGVIVQHGHSKKAPDIGGLLAPSLLIPEGRCPTVGLTGLCVTGAWSERA